MIVTVEKIVGDTILPDNLVKPILDAIKKIRLIEDDSDIFHLEVTKYPTRSEEEIQVSVRN